MKFLSCSFSLNHCSLNMMRVDVLVRSFDEQPGTLTV